MTVPRQDDGSFWIFGYGSLIHRPDLPWVERTVARLDGWSRRFWQGSHDHRGLPHAPGRVVTLVREGGATCGGMAYRVPGAAAERVLAALDHREKNGYDRQRVTLDAHLGRRLEALVYLAPPGNPAWLGPAPPEAMARHIHGSAGPSGHNRDYLLELADALEALGLVDDHVTDLAHRVRSLSGRDTRR